MQIRHQTTPAQTDLNLRSQALSLNVEISAGKALKPVYDDKGVFLGNELQDAPLVASGSPTQRAELARMIGHSLTPPTRDDVEEWLAELSVISPMRADDAGTGALRLEAYVERLCKQPADIVRDVLLVKTWRFFPSWFELDGEISTLRRTRDAMLAACLHKKKPAQDSEQEERVTAERAAQIMAEVGFKAKTFGGKP
jgi:hypothetical protein